ncbi:monovalent cation:proton antiporter-2 (CPA2) family protein [Haloferula luteola]|uniref:Monovalent cation:proton antiporter-2 (CPA2) family protein n=1 Tax=Haloferula luteola TaxID=595692 RepID=A0A840V570_9BACT|nr:monovalent cation:proton antiporter-2 (CPA2) family protein [Haloferula luteola]MBB5352753.1 monovalent cation:proton antiporter-2 (CPA2) family protein [Haloferula luteola]
MAFEEVFHRAFIYLAAALAAILLGKRLGLGAVLGYLVVGAAIGPWGFHFIGSEGEQVTHFAEFGVVVMLFLIGLELHPPMLWRMRRQVLGLGTAQVLVTLAGIAAIAMLCGVDGKSSLTLGMVLALSSTAIVLQTLAEKGLLRTEAGQNSFSVLLFQDVAVIPMLALLPLLGTGDVAHDAAHGGGSGIDLLPGWAQPLATLAAVVLVVVIARVGTRPLFHLIARTRQREAFTGAALLLVIGVALLMTKVGLSPALGAFVAGMVLANNEYRHEIESDLEPFKGLLLALFFLGVGAGIDFGYIREHWILVIGGALGLVAVKGGILYGLSRLQGSSCRPSLLFAASLAAGGEFAFVLLAAAQSAGALTAEIARPIIAMVALSMATTPLLILAAERFIARGFQASPEEREPDVEDEGHPVIICGFGRFGHAVGRLVRNRGIGCTVLDYDSDQVELLRKLGISVFYGDASRGDLLEKAGAARARILIIALREVDATLRILEIVHREFPHLKVFVRAHSRSEAYEYLEAGEERIYRDTLDTSLQMGIDVLQELGFSAEEAGHVAQAYRKRDEQMVRHMARHRHDEKAYLNAAKEAVQSLDALMKSDLETFGSGAKSPEPQE